MSRRTLIARTLGLLSALTGGAAPMRGAPVAGRDRTALAGIERWGCQYLNIDVDALAACDLDMLVIEATIDGATRQMIAPEELARLQTRRDGRRRPVLAYLSVGEAADYRSYWQPAWDAQRPAWLGGENPNWPHAYPVRFWEGEWQAILFGAPQATLDGLVDRGFDGVFLDRIDVYQSWQPERPSAGADMVALVRALAAHARALRPGFLIVAQNAEPLLRDAAYCDAIDAVSKESLLYGLHGPGVANEPDEIAWSQLYLSEATRRGLPVLAIEYLEVAAERDAARARLRQLGFKPFIASRLLERSPCDRDA